MLSCAVVFVLTCYTLSGGNAWVISGDQMQLSGSSCGPTVAEVFLNSSFAGDEPGAAKLQFAAPFTGSYSKVNFSAGMGTFLDLSANSPGAGLESCNVTVGSNSVDVVKQFNVSMRDGTAATVIGTDAYVWNSTRASFQVHTTLSVFACEQTEVESVFSVPIEVGLSIQQNPDMPYPRLWAPWDRESNALKGSKYFAPYVPSDGMDGWWTGSYRLGVEGVGISDRIVAPMVVVAFPLATTARAGTTRATGQSANQDAGIGIHLDPSNAPLDMYLYT